MVILPNKSNFTSEVVLMKKEGIFFVDKELIVEQKESSLLISPYIDKQRQEIRGLAITCNNIGKTKNNENTLVIFLENQYTIITTSFESNGNIIAFMLTTNDAYNIQKYRIKRICLLNSKKEIFNFTFIDLNNDYFLNIYKQLINEEYHKL